MMKNNLCFSVYPRVKSNRQLSLQRQLAMISYRCCVVLISILVIRTADRLPEWAQKWRR